MIVRIYVRISDSADQLSDGLLEFMQDRISVGGGSLQLIGFVARPSRKIKCVVHTLSEFSQLLCIFLAIFLTTILLVISPYSHNIPIIFL